MKKIPKYPIRNHFYFFYQGILIILLFIKSLNRQKILSDKLAMTNAHCKNTKSTLFQKHAFLNEKK